MVFAHPRDSLPQRAASRKHLRLETESGRLDAMNSPDIHDDEPADGRPFTHEQLLHRGCDYCTAEDHFGDTRSGYWIAGDGYGKGYGQFLGETTQAATEALRG